MNFHCPFVHFVVKRIAYPVTDAYVKSVFEIRLSFQSIRQN